MMIDEEQLRGLRSHVRPGPVPPVGEIRFRARRARRRRLGQRAVMSVVVAGAIAAVAVVVPHRGGEDTPIVATQDVDRPPVGADEGRRCADSLVPAEELPAEGRYLVAPSVTTQSLETWYAAAGPCGVDNLSPGRGMQPSATAVRERGTGGSTDVITITAWGPMVSMFTGASGETADVKVRGGTGELLRSSEAATDDAGEVSVSWPEDGRQWVARSSGVAEAELLAAVEALRLEGQLVTEWQLDPDFEVTLDPGATPDERTWRMTAVYGDPEEPGGFQFDIRDRGPEPLAVGDAEPVKVEASDSTVRGVGYVRRDRLGGTLLVWQADDGRLFELSGRIDVGAALDVASNLERVAPDDPRIVEVAETR